MSHNHSHSHAHDPTRSLWRSPTAWTMAIALLFFAAGLWTLVRFGENSLVSAVTFATAIIAGGHSLFRKGLRNISRFRFDMNTLMTVAIIGAAAIGEWWEGAVVVLLFAVSEWLEEQSMERSRRSIRELANIAPKEGVIRREGREVRVKVDDIRPGDIVLVKPGQKIAVDGKVIAGLSSVNQASITGESIPVAKSPGSDVYAGTLNEEGHLEIEATRAAKDTTLAKVIDLVERAQAEKAPAQKFVDQFAKFYTPAIMAFALGIAILPPLLAGADWIVWIYRGLAVLVVGCPCALIISTPVAIVTAIGAAARNGVLIKGGIHLEQAGRITAVALDKTGTLTIGKPAVTDIMPIGGKMSATEALRIAAAIEKKSGHPLASAIVSKASSSGVAIPEPTRFRSWTGKGAEAVIDGCMYRIGSPDWFRSFIPSERYAMAADERIMQWRQDGKTVVLFGTEEDIIAAIAAEDTIREQAVSALEQLRKLGVRRIAMLTGDDPTTAKAVASRTRIQEVAAGLLPEQKLDAVRDIQASDRVAMIGDGVNDAPALAAADVGVAMGGASTDTALETADIALMADDLTKLPFTLRLSRRTLAVIRQNVMLALVLKAAALLLIIPGWLSLWMAIFADMGATLIVTLNAMRLLSVRS